MSSLRTHLLLPVNAVLAVGIALLLFLDYQHEFASRLRQRQRALAEEARIVLHSVLHLRNPSHPEVQEYIDALCGSMRNDQSPGHHIAVRLEGTVFQATAHRRASPQMLSALEAASSRMDHQVEMGEETLVVGSASRGSDVAYVSEYCSDLRRAMLGEVLWRLGALALLALLGAVVANVLIVYLVARPVERLAGTVRQVAQGQLEVQADGYNTAELASLANAINSMSRSLAESARERHTQLERAGRVQEHLLARLASVPGLRLAHLYRPASDMAGDYLDVSSGPQSGAVFAIADVSGHGIGAALEAVVLKTLFGRALETDPAPAAVLRQINGRFFSVSVDDDFATMFIGKWDARTGCLEYASAGHEPAYLFSAAGTRRDLGATGPPLGIDAGGAWSSRAIPVDRGGSPVSGHGWAGGDGGPRRQAVRPRQARQPPGARGRPPPGRGGEPGRSYSPRVSRRPTQPRRRDLGGRRV